MDYNSNNLYRNIGDRVKYLRTERHMSREKFAELIDITSKHLYDIEQGSTNFSIGIFSRICKELNIPSSFLLDETLSTDQRILSELTGRFTEEEKQRIKEILISQLETLSKK